jgi:3'-phosphoadenosine 5'-phosphosulfate sulfotransferase (PAPS reductase)/FAD synthetase
MLTVATTDEIDQLLAAGAPVAIGVSGGKDSSAVALATVRHLNQVGHTGPRILIHSDLGVTEWKESLPMCEWLAEHLGLELAVVRRSQGDMMDRWEQRWNDNVARYADLSCVKLILPWSTPEMRFCTSELKVDQICRYLKKRFTNQTIVSVNGIRREESPERKKAPIAKWQPKLTGKTTNTTGIDWHPIIEWKLEDVLTLLSRRGIPLHEAYTTWGTKRVSCVFCIMSAAADLMAASKCPDNIPLYQRMCDLELESTFAFQGGKWLCDVAPHLLKFPMPRQAIDKAKAAAELRTQAEAWLPKHLLYTKGWPTCIPTPAEAVEIADMRRRVSEAVDIRVGYLHAERVISRYSELFAARQEKLKAKQ